MDVWNDSRNNVCTQVRESEEIDLVIYLTAIADEDYDNMGIEDKEYVKGIYSHLMTCKTCYDACTFLKERMSSDESFSGQFNAENFKRIASNERTLAGLISTPN